MAPEATIPSQVYQLPPSVIGPVDLGRLTDELGIINEQLNQLKLRSSGESVKLPKTSLALDQVLSYNNVNVLIETQREALLKFLADARATAPTIHMSFAGEPSVEFLERLMSWFRKEVHPSVLITIGLQPAMGVGCVMRTTNKYFDFSLKQDFINKRNILRDELLALSKKDDKDEAEAAAFANADPNQPSPMTMTPPSVSVTSAAATPVPTPPNPVPTRPAAQAAAPAPVVHAAAPAPVAPTTPQPVAAVSVASVAQPTSSPVQAQSSTPTTVTATVVPQPPAVQPNDGVAPVLPKVDPSEVAL